MKVFRPFRLRNCCEIVQPLRGAELLRYSRSLESSMVVVRVLKVPEVLDGFLARRIHTVKNLRSLIPDGKKRF
jgi:hypothetical protein